MLRRTTVAMAVALALLPMTGHGLGLGQIRSGSGLNQPFEGEIELSSVTADEMPQVKIRLAPADAYARAGVELSGILGKLQFTPYIKPNGQVAVRVSSADPIREPFLNFLVEAEWPQGKAVKEYTVLLDPPIFTERRGARVRPAEVAPAPAPRPAAAPRSESVAAPAAAAPRAAAGGESYGRVRRGETLWSIAEKTKPAGVSTQKALAAIYAANPQAFIRGDMNKLAGISWSGPRSLPRSCLPRPPRRRRRRTGFACSPLHRPRLRLRKAVRQRVLRRPAACSGRICCSPRKRPRAPCRRPSSSRAAWRTSRPSCATCSGSCS